jgi:Ni,Fe-hydrogenase III small subunit
MGAVETLIVYENLDITRYDLKNVQVPRDRDVHRITGVVD